MPKFQSTQELETYRAQVQARAQEIQFTISICAGTGCLALGVTKVIEAFERELATRQLGSRVLVKPTGCPGFCENGPVVVVFPLGFNYHQVKPEDVPEIIEQTILQQKPVDRLLYTDAATQQKVQKETDIVFYKEQMRVLLGTNIHTDPTQIEDYFAQDGYKALEKALFHLKPVEIVEMVTKANLRGRGGGGFPTGRKWQTTIQAHETPKYVIINCDEGDPGAFMNRALMEGNPHKVLEGFIIGAYAIGAHEGFIYIRDEYPLAVENTKKAIAQAEAYGLLGKNILGSGFDFTIEIHKGAGAFICGESTALMASIEGNVGEPRPKYIHTAEKGLWNKPTVLNNVETWANIPLIINNGVDWFTSIGTAGSKGTKIFSLVGKVVNTGLVEVPLGTTLRKIIFDIGGGIPHGKAFKAVQTGGPSGGCIPAQYLDTPVDFDELTKLGSMMGSGGLIIMDEDTCMVDVAKYFTKFLSEESCGKCVPCREGLRQLLDLLEVITQGKGTPEMITRMEHLSGVIKDVSLCALGQSAPNPVLTTLRYFREEYEAHLRGECPAKVCKPLFQYQVNPETCKACGICKKNCPNEAIRGELKEIPSIIQENCIKCGVCFNVCPFDAILKVNNP